MALNDRALDFSAGSLLVDNLDPNAVIYRGRCRIWLDYSLVSSAPEGVERMTVQFLITMESPTVDQVVKLGLKYAELLDLGAYFPEELTQVFVWGGKRKSERLPTFKLEYGT